jgi:hypothetical protein
MRFVGVAGQTGDSGEAERSFRRENERHSSMIPNTIGAQRRWLFECARKVFGFVKKNFSGARSPLNCTRQKASDGTSPHAG